LIKEVFESTGAHLEIWNWGSGSYSVSCFSSLGVLIHMALAVFHVPTNRDR
jgi:hypothetical protein